MFNVSVNDKKNIYRSKPVMNVDTTGSSDNISIPKPLTYDYMPEGYPSKSLEAVTLMEEQEVAFTGINGAYGATSPVQFDISVGQTFTVVWDGAEYSCVGHAIRNTSYIGNLAAFGLEATSEPFLYVNGEQPAWASYDTATSHTISVITQGAVYEKIDENFLPKSVFTDADWDFVSNKPFFNNPLNTQITGEASKSNIYAGNDFIDLGVTAPSFNEGLYYKVEGEVSFLNNTANQMHTLQINKYCEADSFNSIPLGTIYDSAANCNFNIRFYGNNSFYQGQLCTSSSGSNNSSTITANFTIMGEVKKLSEDFMPPMKNLNVAFIAKNGSIPTSCNVTYDELRGWVENNIPVLAVLNIGNNHEVYILGHILIGEGYIRFGENSSGSDLFKYNSDGTFSEAVES